MAVEIDQETYRGLVLDRKVGSRTFITFEGKKICVVVAKIRQGSTKLLFLAPPDVEINREEALLKKAEESLAD